MTSATASLAKQPVTQARYPAALRALHWSITLLFAAQFALIGILKQLESLEFGQMFLALHRQSRTLLLLLVMIRLMLIGRARPPRLDAPRWQALAARTVHIAMFAALAAQPILGILVSWARGDDIMLLGLVKLPTMIALTTEQGVALAVWHRWLAFGLLTLLAIHLGAIGYNRIFRGTWVTERMLSDKGVGRLVNRVPVSAQLCGCFGLILALVASASFYSAHEYSTFKALRSHFDEAEVSLLDDMRVAQIDLIRKSHDGTDMRDIAATVHAFGDRASDPGVRAAIATAATAIDRATKEQTGDASRAAADSALQSAIDSQYMVVFQGRLTIEQNAAKGHDLIIIALMPTILLCVVLAFLLSRSILMALTHARSAVLSIEQEREDQTLSIAGEGEFARLMRDIMRMRDTVKIRLEEAHARELESARAQKSRAAEAVAREAELARRHADEQGRMVEEVGRGLAALVDGRLDYRMTNACPEGFDRIRLDFNEAISRVEAAMTILATSSDAIGASTQDVARTAGNQATRSNDQAIRVGKAARMIDVMTGHMETSAQSAQQVAAAVGSVRSKAHDSSAIVDRAIIAMHDVEVASMQIAEIIGTIEQIAARSNLLALNATIEARRAGEAGLGFAVVAGEVRALSQQAAEATDRIRGLMENASRQMDAGVASVRQTGEVLHHIVEDVTNANRLVEAIASSAREQASELGIINREMEEMDGSVRDDASAARQTNAELEKIRDNSVALNGLIKRLTGNTGGNISNAA